MDRLTIVAVLAQVVGAVLVFVGLWLVWPWSALVALGVYLVYVGLHVERIAYARVEEKDRHEEVLV